MYTIRSSMLPCGVPGKHTTSIIRLYVRNRCRMTSLLFKKEEFVILTWLFSVPDCRAAKPTYVLTVTSGHNPACHCPCCDTKITKWMVDTITKTTFLEMAGRTIYVEC